MARTPNPDAKLRDSGAREERFPPPSPPGQVIGRLRVLSVADALSARPRTYLLHGLIAPGELSLWWGAPKCGKSFLLLRLAYGLALGRGMWEREGKPCRVLYVAAEGVGGVYNRLKALHRELGDPCEAFRFIAQRVIVGDPATDLKSLIEAAAVTQANLIVLDTLARTFGEGDESSARDMGQFIQRVDDMRARTGAHVAVIHHGTKLGQTARGSGAMEAAADLIVKVARGTDDGPNLATVEAAKDDIDGAILPFRLRVVELAPAPDGKPVATCIAQETDSPPSDRRKRAASGKRATALAFLMDAVAAEGTPLPSSWGMATDLRGIPLARWADECERRHLVASDNPKNRRDVFNRTAGQLRDGGFLSMRDGFVWPL